MGLSWVNLHSASPDVQPVVTQANFNTCSGNFQDQYCGIVTVEQELELHTEQASNGKPSTSTCLLFKRC